MDIAIIGTGNISAGLAETLAKTGNRVIVAGKSAADAGFDPVDAGPLRNARYLEPLGYLNIQFGYMLGHGTQIVPAWMSREAA